MEQNLPVEISDPFDRVNERSFINLLPTMVQNYLIKAQQVKPGLFGLEERQLEKILKAINSENRGPSGTENALRMRFWIEYDIAQEETRNMRMLNIIAGVTDEPTFYRLLLKPEKVAWLLCKPASYETATEEMHLLALSRLRKILEADPMLGGKLDVRLAEKQLKIFQILDTRVKGAVVQKTISLNAEISAKKAKEAGLLPTNPVEKKLALEKRLAELERSAEQKAGTAGQIIDATIVSD